MAMFLAEIAFLLELALFAAGLVLWHRGREATAGLLRTAGAVLVVGAALTAVCTGYFSVRYHVQGEFDHAYAARAPAAGHGTMGPGMMRPGMRERGMAGMPMGPEPGIEDPEPEAHHPGAEE